MISQKLNKILKKLNRKQMKKECELCHQILCSRQSYLQHKATQHHIGKYKCPHDECDRTENDRYKIHMHWAKRHAQASMKSLYGLSKFQPFKLDTKKQVWVISQQKFPFHFNLHSIE